MPVVTERYTPKWISRMLKDGGGLDKAILQAITAVCVGTRMTVAWSYDERRWVTALQ